MSIGISNNITKSPEEILLINRTKGLTRLSERRNIAKWVFREVTETEERNRVIKLRSEFYREGEIAESKVDNYDPFDIGARFFILEGDEENHGYISKCLRAVSRKTFGVLPSELSLMTLERLAELSAKFASKDNYEVTWKQSTMKPEERARLKDLLDKYSGSKRVHEIGGLFGKDPHFSSSLAAILGIAKVGYEEKWDLVLQTQHPRHVFAYQARMGLPYQKMTDIYNDHCGRLAITLALEGKRFQEEYKKKLAKIAERLF